MKISYNWLKNYVDFNLSPRKLSEVLTNTGLEVEGLERFESVKGGLEGIVIGEVLNTEKHPNADKLSLTTVDIGKDDPLKIVCGAPNVEAGQKVPVAITGTTLYFDDKPFKIKKTKIRGEVSEGMICAEDEIGLGTSHEGIMVLDPKAKPGMLAKEYFEIKQDHVYDIGLTPNRTDAISHLGTARDLVAAFNHLNKTRKFCLKKPSVEHFKTDNNDRYIDVVIEDKNACPRYSGITISGIKVKESPGWLKNYLNAIGIRPINNIVDITNFVLFELGQPLHAFNADQITGDKVIIKKLPQGTKFQTLDNIERELTKDDLMICNTKGGMCIAGVFGGINTGVNEKTRNVFLESAYFNPKSIRKTASHHKLQTDASFRFERGADPNITVYALKRAALLIKDIAGGKISSVIVDKYPNPIKRQNINIKYKNIKRITGKAIDHTTTKNILHDLDIEIKYENEEGLSLLIPTYRVDVTIEADVIEEILRIYGYNNIETSDRVISSISYTSKPDPHRLKNIISDYLTSNGFYEIINNSLTNSKYIEFSKNLKSENNVQIFNPNNQELDVLRQNLLFGGLEAIAYNHNRKSYDLKFYEFGRIYHLRKSKNKDPLTGFKEYTHIGLFITGKKHKESWATIEENTDIYYLKAFTNNILEQLGLKDNKLSYDTKISEDFLEGIRIFHQKDLIAELGQVCQEYTDKFDITQDVFYANIHWDKLLKLVKEVSLQYKEIPKFPAVRRDLALLVNKDVNFQTIKELAFKAEKELLKSVSLFDIYEGRNIEKGKKSYALSFILQNPEKTLTDKVIDKTMDKLIKTFQKQINAVIR